jgi:hypothetical protein
VYNEHLLDYVTPEFDEMVSKLDKAFITLVDISMSLSDTSKPGSFIPLDFDQITYLKLFLLT